MVKIVSFGASLRFQTSVNQGCVSVNVSVNYMRTKTDGRSKGGKNLQIIKHLPRYKRQPIATMCVNGLHNTNKHPYAACKCV